MSGVPDADRAGIERPRGVATDCRHGIGRDLRGRGSGALNQSRRGFLGAIRGLYKVVATSRSRIRVLVRSRERSFRPVRSLRPGTDRHL